MPSKTAKILGMAKDVTGRTSGQLTCVRPVRGEPTGKGGLGVLSWVCRCACGVEVTLRLNHSHMPKSCGCQKQVRMDLTGKVFGRLTAISEKSPSKWFCRCSCGGVKEDAISYNLVDGSLKSCGCLLYESQKKKKPKAQKPMPWYLKSYKHAV